MKKQIGRFLAAGMVLALAGCMVTTAAFAQEELSEAVSEQPGAQMSEPGREKVPVKKHLHFFPKPFIIIDGVRRLAGTYITENRISDT